VNPADLFIPAAPKDYNKLPYVIEAAREHVQAETIHIVTPSETGYDWPGVVWHRDGAVLPYDRAELPYRPNWTFQQLLKLFQDVTEHDWYLVIDADIVVNKPLSLWNEAGQPILYLARDQHHNPYFEFNQRVLGYGKVYDHSFLSECTLYHKKLVRDMLAFAGMSRDDFWRLLLDTSVGCCPAESELYGSYVVHERPDVYEIRTIKTRLGGKYGSHIWTEEEINDQLKEARTKDPDAHLISLHSWEGKD